MPDDERKKNIDLAASPEFLIESARTKPLPEQVACTKMDGKRELVVQTKFHKYRLDFVIDTKTYLPKQWTAYGDDGRSSTVLLQKYVPVDGIMMPSHMVLRSSDGDMTYNYSYQMNVDYDESIFQTVPAQERGPEAWKKR
jgi:hypothetical protein